MKGILRTKALPATPQCRNPEILECYSEGHGTRAEHLQNMHNWTSFHCFATSLAGQMLKAYSGEKAPTWNQPFFSFEQRRNRSLKELLFIFSELNQQYQQRCFWTQHWLSPYIWQSHGKPLSSPGGYPFIKGIVQLQTHWTDRTKHRNEGGIWASWGNKGFGEVASLTLYGSFSSILRP